MGVRVADACCLPDTEAPDVALSSLGELSVPAPDKSSAAWLFEKVVARAVLCHAQGCRPKAGIGQALEPLIEHTIELWRDFLAEQFSLAAGDLPFDDGEARGCFEGDKAVGQIVFQWERLRDIETALLHSDQTTGDGVLSGRIVAIQQLVALVSPPNASVALANAPSAIIPVLESGIHELSKQLPLSSHSPLSGAMQAPLVNAFLHELAEAAEQLVANPGGTQELRVSKSQLEAIRREAAQCLKESEKDLRCLAGLVAGKLLGDVEISVEVNGQKMSPSRRCLALEAAVEDRDSLASSSSDTTSPLIISYQSKQILDEGRAQGVEEIRTRFKAPGSLLNKLVDRLLGLHSSTPNDFSRYLKDVRGMSVIVNSEEDVRRLSRVLHSLSFSDEELMKFGVEPTAATRSVVTFNTRDRLSGDSAWRGIKFVLVWNGSCTEVQIKTRDFLEKERKSDTPESHQAYKKRQERTRHELAEGRGLGEAMAFYRGLLEYVLVGSSKLPSPPNSIVFTVDD